MPRPEDFHVSISDGPATVADHRLLSALTDDRLPAASPEVLAARAGDSADLLRSVRVEAVGGAGDVWGVAVGAQELARRSAWSLEGGVVPERRRRGVGRALVAAASAATGPDGATCTTSTPEGEAFLRSLGAVVGTVRLVQAVGRPTAVPHGSSPRGCTMASWEGPTPSDRLVALARLLGLISGDIEPSELRRQERRTQRFGIQELTIGAVTANAGDLVGYTDVAFDPAVPTIARIGGTAVDEGWRGQGLARWLKVEAMRRAFHRWPGVERIVTDNAADNAPIRAINHDLGFVTIQTLQDWWLPG